LKGEVFLVGAGPGDPNLLTLKAYDLIQKGDIILYDRLVSQEILDLIPNHVETIYVGKDHYFQEEINQLMLQLVKKGKKVIRLKSGDPFIFGRGSEEVQFFKNHNISYYIIPGISSITGIPSSVGIPLTHRTLSSSIIVLTGTEDPLKEQEQIDWRNVAKVAHTIVILMGVGKFPTIIDQLLSCGKDPNTPVAIIEWGTTSKEKLTIEKLSNIKVIAKQKRIQAPSLILIGKVVSLHKDYKMEDK